MRNLIKLATAVTLLLATGVSMAAGEVKKVPKHSTFMNLCLSEYGETTDKLTMAVGLAICQCSFDKLPTDGDMTEAEFNAANKQCLADFDADPQSFTKRNAEKAIRLFPKE